MQAQESFYSNDYEIALYYIDKSIALNPSHFSYFKRAQIHLKLNEPYRSLEDLDIALSINEDYTNALELKELILERVKQERDYTMGIYLLINQCIICRTIFNTHDSLQPLREGIILLCNECYLDRN